MLWGTRRSEPQAHEDPSIERRLLRVGSWAMAALGLGGLVNNVVLGVAPLATVVLGLVALCGGGLLLAERRGIGTPVLARVFVLVSLSSVALSWLSAGGIRSSISTLAPILACVGVLVLPLGSTLRYLLCLLLLTLGLVGVERAWPQHLAPIISGWAGIVDYTAAAWLAITTVGLATYALRKAYVRDRQRLVEHEQHLAAARADLERALAAAQRSDAAKSLFLAHMSHELRTPLSGVLGHAQLLAGTSLPPEAREHVDALARSSRHLRRLVDDLLDLGRIERDEFIKREEDVLLADLLRDAVADARSPTAPPIELVLDAALPERLRLDAGRLRQVVTNLVVNAVRHADATRIQVQASLEADRKAGERLRLSVIDDGRGIAADKLPTLFQPFERDARSALSGGLGLGLYVVKRVVQALDGELTVDTQPGHGCAFHILLALQRTRPVDLANAAQAASAETSPSSPLPPGLRVLTADDDPLVRTVLLSMFRRLGVDPVSVSDGPSAIARAKEQPFDFVFLDMNMPGATGPQVARAIRQDAEQQGRPVPTLVALTASAYDADEQTCKDAGMQRFLAKPIALDDLRTTLHEAAHQTLLRTNHDPPPT